VSNNLYIFQTLQYQIEVEETPVRRAVLLFLCKQTQQRSPHFRSCRYLSDISTVARNLVRAVCTFPQWRKVRGFELRSPRFIVIVSFSPMRCIAAIVAIKGCNSLSACFLTSMEKKRFFKMEYMFWWA